MAEDRLTSLGAGGVAGKRPCWRPRDSYHLQRAQLQGALLILLEELNLYSEKRTLWCWSWQEGARRRRDSGIILGCIPVGLKWIHIIRAL